MSDELPRREAIEQAAEPIRLEEHFLGPRDKHLQIRAARAVLKPQDCPHCAVAAHILKDDPV